MNKLISSLSFLFLVTSLLLSQNVVINEVVSSNKGSLVDEDGDFPDWIEFYFSGDETTDLSAYGLSDDRNNLFKWSFPTSTLISESYLVVFASGKDRDYLHTNFSIRSSGESIYLTNPTGVVIDSVNVGALPSDVSFGRKPDGDVSWCYFLTPTPNSENNTMASETPTPFIVDFFPEGGLYSGSVNVSLSANSAEDIIYYTQDGSIPTKSSTLYSGAIELNETKVVRACVFSDGVFSDQTTTHTYLIDKETELPIVSISAIPDDLWDKDTGIYIDWESDREIPVHIEFYTPEGTIGFSQDAGMKIFGGWSRHFPQKSFALFARSKYGNSSFDYVIFPDLSTDKYESFIMRNSGGDFDESHVRDAMMQGLIADLDLETQAYRPAVIYLNGEYWGILNMREKLNEHYIEAHQGVGEENLDMLENEQGVIHGNADHYEDLLSYIQSNDMTATEAYNHVKDQIDLSNYLDYMVSELYFANVDWPGWNIKYWRPRTADGKWRWMVYDLDDGFGLGHTWNFGYDTMYEFATATDGDDWPNPPWSTLLFRRLLENDEFTIDFINRYADNMNTIWQASVVNYKINSLQDNILAEMSAHLDRWDLSYDDWGDAMEKLHEFANERVEEVRSNTISEFDLTGLATVTIQIEPATGGSVMLNDNLGVWGAEWQGVYFQGIPVDVQAMANAGYQFLYYEIDGVSETNSKLNVPLSGNTTIIAKFELTGTAPSPIVINEINYHSAPDYGVGDWVELFNNSDETVDVSDWVFRDEVESHQLVFPEGTTIRANDFLVLCNDRDDFLNYFPEVQVFSSSFDFGLSNSGEFLCLLDAGGEYADSLRYSDQTPWPTLADGYGATLLLKNPFSDNAIAQNWKASLDNGTPGFINESYSSVIQRYDANYMGLELGNYPNPFNVETTISFSVESQGRVQLNIYDMLGTKLATLIDEVMEPGRHEIVWHPEVNLETGIYIYHIGLKQESNSGIMIFQK